MKLKIPKGRQGILPTKLLHGYYHLEGTIGHHGGLDSCRANVCFAKVEFHAHTQFTEHLNSRQNGGQR